MPRIFTLGHLEDLCDLVSRFVLAFSGEEGVDNVLHSHLTHFLLGATVDERRDHTYS